MEKLDNFIFTPRYLTDMRRDGKISVKEYLLLSWIRNNGDPYGVTTTSLDDLAHDLGLGKNYVNRILLSLKGKKLIDYENRSGRRGSFRIHLDFWKLPNKSIKKRGEFYGRGEIRDSGNTPSLEQAEPSPSFSMDIQMFEEEKSKIGKYRPGFLKNKFRGSNNDTDKDKELEEESSLKEEETKPKSVVKQPYYDATLKKIVEP